MDGEITATTLRRGSKLAYREFVAPAASLPSGALSSEEFLAARARARGGQSLSEARKLVGEQLYKKGGSPIAKYRLLRGWSQQDLAAALGTTQSHVSRMESGADLLLDTVKRLAVVLEVNSTQLASELIEQP
jgi:ribosome-binding protein aMBF1 (putative translation factor)